MTTSIICKISKPNPPRFRINFLKDFSIGRGFILVGTAKSPNEAIKQGNVSGLKVGKDLYIYFDNRTVEPNKLNDELLAFEVNIDSVKFSPVVVA